MHRTYLDFEEPLRVLDRARDAAIAQGDRAAAGEVDREIETRSRVIFDGLSPWQRVQLARHLDRPFTLDYVAGLLSGFVELHGDRTFADDPAVVAGLAFRGGRPLVVVGHQRGRGTAEKVHRNFGMPRPEGFRKARRVFELAGRLGLPVLTFVDTQGAFPGAESEERGVAEAIAGCLATLAGLPVPVVAAVVGEGGSGGALAFSVADALVVLEHACLSVITPEGCASILERRRTPEGIERAAASLRFGGADLVALGIADVLVAEPPGGAHRDPRAAIASVGAAIDGALASLDGFAGAALRARRDARLRRLGSEAVAMLG